MRKNMICMSAERTAPDLGSSQLLQAGRVGPAGHRLRFSVLEPKTQASSLWEVSADGSNLHPLLPGWNNPQESMGETGHQTADIMSFIPLATAGQISGRFAKRGAFSLGTL